MLPIVCLWLRRWMCLLLAASAFLSAGVALAQQDPPHVSARLELKDAKSTFLLGEPVELVLAISGDDPRYGVAVEPDWNEFDRVTLTSAQPVFRWKEPDEHYQSDMLYAPPQGEIHARTSILLNDVFRFTQPGSYTVVVTSFRLTQKGVLAKVPLTTNSVTFNLQPMDAKEEARRVMELAGQIDEVKEDTLRKRAAVQLSTLRGDAAAREKVRLFLDKDQWFRKSCCYVCAPIDDAIERGLALSDNLPLEIELLDRAWKAPDRAPASEVLARMKILQGIEAGIPIPGAKWAGAYFFGITWQQMADQPAAVLKPTDPYLDEITASMPLRTGKVRAESALFVYESAGMGSEAPLAIRAIVLEQFDSYGLEVQTRLLQNEWNGLKMLAITPVLERICAAADDPAALKRTMDALPEEWRHDMLAYRKMLNEVALIRLLQASPEQGRPYLIAALRGALPAGEPSTPETLDAAFLEGFRVLPTLDAERHKRLIRWLNYASLEGSAAIYEQVMAVYREHAAAMEVWDRGALLAYLMRWDADRAMALVAREESEKLGVALLQSMSFVDYWRGREYPEPVRAFLRGVVVRGSAADARGAAAELARHGLAADVPALRERLAALQAEWKTKPTLLSGRSPDLETRDAFYLEQALIAALRNAAWGPTPAELASLKADCLGDFCEKITPRPIPVEPWELERRWPNLNDFR